MGPIDIKNWWSLFQAASNLDPTMPEHAGRDVEELFKAVGVQPRLVTFNYWGILRICNALDDFSKETEGTKKVARQVFSAAKQLVDQKETERLKDIFRVALLAFDCYYAEKGAEPEPNYYKRSAQNIAYYLKRHLYKGEGATGICDELEKVREEALANPSVPSRVEAVEMAASASVAPAQEQYVSGMLAEELVSRGLRYGAFGLDRLEALYAKLKEDDPEQAARLQGVLERSSGRGVKRTLGDEDVLPPSRESNGTNSWHKADTAAHTATCAEQANARVQDETKPKGLELRAERSE